VRIGEVIGRVVLSRCDREFEAGRFMIVRPFDLDALEGKAPPTGEIVVAYDELSASNGMQVGLSEGREAAMPFHPKPVALDVYIGCLLDEVVVESEKAGKRRSDDAT
jgi:ethanolamine utilization protein EutN